MSRRGAPWLAVTACVVTIAWAAITVVAHPLLLLGGGFLFGDQGINLLAAGAIVGGDRLYRDVAYPYGPASAYLHALATVLAGNTPATYLSLLALLSSLAAVLATFLIWRAASPHAAAVVTLVGLLPVLATPGSIVGGTTVSPYVQLERMLLLAVALLWSDPQHRPPRRYVTIGIALGSWQLVKVGGGLVAGGAVILLDAVILMYAASGPAPWATWLRGLARLALAFTALELARAAVAFLVLPPPVAFDVLWPAFMLETYTWVTEGLRWPGWIGWKGFAVQYLPVLSAGIAGTWSFVRLLLRQPGALGARGAEAAAVLLPLVFYLLASAGYFRQVFHFRQFAWALVPAAVLAVDAARSRLGLLAAVALCLPAWGPLLNAVALMNDRASSLERQLPTGGRLHLTPAADARVAFLEDVARTAGGPVLFLPVGSGWHYAYGIAAATRHTWFYSPNAVRPYERGSFVASARRASLVIHCIDDSARPREFEVPLHEDLRAQIMSDFVLSEERHDCRVFRPRRGSRSGEWRVVHGSPFTIHDSNDVVSRLRPFVWW